MLDIHTHLYWKDFDEDRDDVIMRAKAADVSKMISVGTDMETSRQAIQVAQAHEGIWASIGIHPHEFNESEISHLESWGKELRELAKHPKVIGIGECGLDYFGRDREVSDDAKARQKAAFLMQLELASELDLPLIIHTRPSSDTQDAYEDVFGILKANAASEARKLKAVLHCYQGDIEVTKKFLELPNVYFSFAGNITYPVKQALVGTKDDLTETVKLVPLERLFTETDCPFLAPQAKRGERNEPSFVQYVVEKAAELHGTDMDGIASQTERNFERVFGVVS